MQIIKTPAGEELVVIPRAEYDALVRIAEEADEDAMDVAVYDARKAEGGAPLPAEVSMAMLRGDSRLRALRGWRDVGQVELANRIGTSQGFISDLENGRRAITDSVRERLAEVLDIPEQWL